MTSKKAWAISVAASILLVVLVFVGLFGAGYRFFVVKTPSMATVAPVGTLVVVQPERSYAVGDVISFQRGPMSYTHRIVGAQSVQGWATKGDLNASVDPLLVTDSQIIGKVVYCAKYVGFLVDALPWLLLGSAIVWAITLLPRVRPSWRWQIRLVGWSMVASLVALFQRPWVNMVMMGYVSDPTSGVDMHLVNTGIFPVKVKGTVLSSGQDAVVNLSVVDPTGHYSVTPQLALNFSWFLTLVVICLAPTIISLFVKVEDPVAGAEATTSAPEAPKTRIRRIVLSQAFAPALVVLVAILAVSLVLQAGTQSAFSSSIKNSVNTAGTRTWFTCQNAEVGTAGAQFVWPMSAITSHQEWNWLKTTYYDDTDDVLNNNARPGRVYGTSPSVNQTSSPCPRDTAQKSLNFTGNTCLTQTTAATAPKDYSLEVWFHTTTKANGKLIGFGDDTAAADGKYDRHLYIDSTGRLIFGTYSRPDNIQHVIVTAKSYTDGGWHHAVATSTAAGALALYVDGVPMGTATNLNQEVYTGYWKVGCGNLNTWQDSTTTWLSNWPNYFTGQLRFAAVYSTTLTATQALEHYQAGI